MDLNYNLEAFKGQVVDIMSRFAIPTDALWPIIGVSVFVSFVFGYLINKWIGGSNRGFLASGMGLILSWLIGLALFILVRINVELFLEDSTWFIPLSITIATMGFFLILILITPLLLGVDFLRAIVVFLINSVVVVLGVYLVLKLVASGFFSV